MAPANIRDPRMGAALLHFAARYAHGLPAKLDIALPDTPPTTAEELRHVEATHQVCSVMQDVDVQASAGSVYTTLCLDTNLLVRGTKCKQCMVPTGVVTMSHLPLAEAHTPCPCQSNNLFCWSLPSS